MLSPGAADNDDGLGHQLVDLRLCPMMQVKTLHHALLVEPVAGRLLSGAGLGLALNLRSRSSRSSTRFDLVI